MTNEKAIDTINDLKQYYTDKNENSCIGFDNEDNEALDMAIKALEQQPYEDNTEGENECNKDCIHCRWTTCPLVEFGKTEPYTQKIKEIRNAYKEGYDEGYDRGYIIGEAQADAWLVIQEHINDILDKIRTEIEQIADEEQKHDEKWAIGLRYAVKIIDKYTER